MPPDPPRHRGGASVLLLLTMMGCGSGSQTTTVTPIPLCPGADPGPAPIRRLTRFELGHALADALQVDPALAQRLPPDERSLGFDNNASAYSVSPAHAMNTLEMAEAAAAQFVGDGARVRAVAGCDPLSPAEHATCLPTLITGLGARLWRRPLDDGEVTALMALDAAETDPADPAAGVSAVVAALLQAPDFLYRPEPRPLASATAPVDATALATRLSYLLTSAGPDDALLASAASGQLATREGLLAETDRLLAGPHALESFQHFMFEWWELEALPDLQKDTNLFRAWNQTLPAALTTETRDFLAEAWQVGPTLEWLLRSPTTYADPALATFYGYPAVTAAAGAGFQPIAVDPARASGLFTQGAFLATHARTDQTSPILRGKFVRAQLLCAPPPPPPANIVITPPSVDPRLSTRERFEKHTADPFCAACHGLMDPIGFSFEHFDAVGRWRDSDGGKPVDALGSLTGTDVDGPVNGVADLSKRLVGSGQVRTCVATQWFRWAFGRDRETDDDLCVVNMLSAALASSGGDLRALARATVTTPTFLNVRGNDAP